MNGFMMDYIKIDSPEKRRIITYLFRESSDNEGIRPHSIDFLQFKEEVITNDSVIVGYSDGKPEMTTTTDQPIIYSSPVNPSFFQYDRDSVINLDGKNYFVHHFITKSFYFKNDTLFVGAQSYDYFCDSDFLLVYTSVPYPIISFDYGDGIPNREDVVHITRMDEHLIPPKIVKELKKRGKKDDKMGSPYQL